MEVFPDNFTTRWCICAQQKVLQQETIFVDDKQCCWVRFLSLQDSSAAFLNNISAGKMFGLTLCEKHRLQQKNKHERIVYVYHRHALW